MIGINDEDRNYQKFLWWEDSSSSKIKVYQHARAVFGVTTSPFLLGGVLELHLSKYKGYQKKVAQKLLRSLYVDNSITSVETIQEMEEFKRISTSMMQEAKMELREWESTMNKFDEVKNGKTVTSVLGLTWDKQHDTISILYDPIILDGPVTKRKILSKLHQVFDPIGFTCPATLQPKLLLQDSWKSGVKWDEELEEKTASRFTAWINQAHVLREIRIPRLMMISSPDSLQLHLFTDASRYAFAAVVYARSFKNDKVKVTLIQAKSRVAPVKGGTIPRLELVGCLIGARLLELVKSSMDVKIDRVIQWTDSTTALAWIQRDAQLSRFVGNRVKEIREKTRVEDWRHVPGNLNPADLPSRGCTPQQLLESLWWEGPPWLKQPEGEWPSNQGEVDEDEYTSELVKSKMTLQSSNEAQWFQTKFSTYKKNVRVMAWILRFINNCKVVPGVVQNENGQLSAIEVKNAEKCILKVIQDEALDTSDVNLAKKLSMVKRDGLFCVETRLLDKEDTQSFKWPVILPKHPLTNMMITELHRVYGHAGAQFLLCKLREKYWILGGRRTVKTILHQCPRCRRFDARPVNVQPAPLPKARVNTAEVFETTGVDLAGPLQLKDKTKAWVVLYTCAVYRCVHFDVVTSTSAEVFLGSLERFINQYGRPRSFYSDNGTNFVGVVNLMRALDWEKVVEQMNVQNIRWTFNPPSAPWWGGWWERLVRSVKNQLRRILGNARLTYDELRTSLSTVQATINDRPLTAITEDEDDLIPLTPAMFLHPSRSSHFPEGGIIGADELQGAYKRMQVIQKKLQGRFRTEYLAQLVQKGKEKGCHPIQVGDIVLIGADNMKRFQWPMGRVIELIPGRDGKIRVAKIQTPHDYGLDKKSSRSFNLKTVKKGRILTRPLQRLYPLEIATRQDLPVPEKVKELDIQIHKERKAVQEEEDDMGLMRDNPADVKTRGGRIARKVSRFGQWISHLSLQL
ncbi:uncharacterized protein LOC110854452 [Folsomia candida]|uniref:uncharacterized protein LOC110854452 n=1 Tax=Folsomia candida TaxID=158441 RepID=UPI000B90038C|nr:uncharacterized protein LOC110854452 [Folsomia candida]